LTKTTDKVALDQWYAIDTAAEVGSVPKYTRLLGQDLVLCRAADGSFDVRELDDHGRLSERLPTQVRYGCLWTTLGTPQKDIFRISEAEEDDRNQIMCGWVRMRASALRVVENFLDMAHFPFVHTDILGAEPHTEVRHYNTEIRRETDEVWATDCVFYQPQAAKSATTGIDTRYTYRVASPFVTLLYKTCPIAANRWDVICLFVQPMEPDRCRAHPTMYIIDSATPRSSLIAFQLLIFLQDRIILENQRPRLLPLEPRSEIPTRADICSVVYRRWLKEKGLTYGTCSRGC
jgi:phenylpropionate dioxygenase-like ring-hydroxylating dioxygenase large terminal subunit